jgi:DNA-binding FadR family transcriptional regulator
MDELMRPRMKQLKRKRTLSEEVERELKNYILRNGLKPKDQLPPETELSRQLGISRNAVREGVKRLESLGVLEARPGAGLFVRSFSFEPILDNLAYGLFVNSKQFVDLLDVRAYLETALAEAITTTIPPEQLGKLRALLQEWADAAKRGDASDEYDRRFHQVLIEHLDNPMLAQVIDLFWLMVHRASEWTSIPGPLNPESTYHLHVNLVEAIAQHDVESVRKWYGQHFEASRGRFRRAQQQLENDRAALREPSPAEDGTGAF